MTRIKETLGIIGSGKIGEALINGLLASKKISLKNICSSDISKKRREFITKKYSIDCLSHSRDLVRKSEIVILAVKPDQVKSVLGEIRDSLTSKTILISVAAGVTINYIARILKKQIPIIRVMPNIPILLGEGMIVLTTTKRYEQFLTLVTKIFETIGRVIYMEEETFNAVTALSGSGPAYIFMVIDALIEAAVKLGIPREDATLLSSQTVLGAAKMVLETHQHPMILKDMVTTPGGVTIEGLLQLEEGKLKKTIINAIIKGAEKSNELSFK